MTTIDITYTGDLRCEAVHRGNGRKITTDAPLDNQGKAEFFSPTDLLAAALGTCIATIMGIIARKDGIDLRGMTMTVVKEMTKKPPRRIDALTLEVRMPVRLDGEMRARYEKVAHLCPVHESLLPDIRVQASFIYPP